MASPGSQSKDRVANRPNNGGRTADTAGGAAGAQTLAGGPTITRNQPVQPTGPNIKSTPGQQAPVQNDRRVSINGRGDITDNTPPAGGSATTYTPEPGVVDNYPYANAAAIADLAASALPGGLANAVPGIVGDIEDPTKPHAGALGQMLGADYGPRVGYQRDRSRGAGSYNPNDPRGADPDERAIAGSRIGAGTEALTGDDSDVTVDENTGPFSDVTLQDRRKPRTGAGTQMLLGM